MRYYDPREDKIPGYSYLYVFLGVVLLAALVLLLPAIALHSRTPQGAWHWTLGCTVGCCIWWGILLSIAIWTILAKANSPAVRAMEKARSAHHVPQPLHPDLRLMWVTGFLD